MAARRGIEVADAGREGVEPVQRLAEGVQRQRLHVVLHVGPAVPVRRPREGAQLRRRHAHRPAAQQGVLQADQCLAPGRVGHGVEGLDAVDAKHGADLQVVLQVLADAGVVQPGLDARGAHHVHRADARQLQDLRRADGASTQDDLAPAMQRPAPVRRPAAALPRHGHAAAQKPRHPAAAGRSASRCAPPGWGRCRTGRMKALAAFQRTPRRWLTSK